MRRTDEMSPRAQLVASLRANALRAPIVFLVGPAGIGKSTLLRSLLDEPAHRVAGAAPLLLDATESTRATLLADMLRGLTEGRCVYVDGWEHVRGDAVLRRWLSSPRHPRARLSIAGRERPAPLLTAALLPGQLHVAELPPLSPNEALQVLRERGVASKLCGAIIARADGNPLALALLSAHRGEQEPLALSALIDEFVGELPSGPQRDALEALAFLPYANEEALLAVAPSTDPSVFDWLRRRSYVRQASAGLHLHEALADALRRHLLWRRPEAVAKLVDHILRGLELSVNGAARAPSLWSVHVCLFLLTVTPFRERSLLAFGRAPVDPISLDLVDEAEELLRDAWGAESASLLRGWLAGGGVGAATFDEAGRMSGLAVHLGTDWEPGDDPLLQRLRREIPHQPLAVLRVCVQRGRGFVPSDEVATLGSWTTERNWPLSSDSQYVTVVDDPEPWLAVMERLGGTLRSDLAVAVGDRSFTPHLNPFAGAKAMIPQLLSFVREVWPPPPALSAPQPSADGARPPLAEGEALRLVRQALAHWRDAHALGHTELAQALHEDGPALQARLTSLVAETQSMRPTGVVRRVLEAAYDGRFGGQESAAAACAMSLPSFKRYKRQGLERLAALLSSVPERG